VRGLINEVDNIELSFRIRIVENKLLDLFAQGLLNGTVHTSVGQEFSAVAFCNQLESGDVVFSNHRCHGHFIALTKDERSLIAELMGKSTGICGGIGGSQHLHAPNFYSNGPQGALSPVAAGMALGMKLDKMNNVVLCFIGDGTLGEGIVYESLNLSSLYSLPILYICENNKYAQSTPIEINLSGDIKGRAESFGMKVFEGNTWDYQSLFANAKVAIEEVRNGSKSGFFLVNTYRLNAHSKGDDLRDPHEISTYYKRDPVNVLLNNNKLHERYKVIEDEIDNIIDSLKNDSEMKYEDFQRLYIQKPKYELKLSHFEPIFREKQVDRIYKFFKENMNTDKNIYLLGEDILHPYGGAFKVTRNLSDIYPDNIIGTPISEAGITGLGIGLSLTGKKPFVEIMFGDFLSYSFDQILSNASKFFGMYNGKIKVPLVIRTPMGGGRGYGPTHSQSLEKHLIGLNQIKVLALNFLSNINEVYGEILNEEDTVILIENKIDYGKLQIEIPQQLITDFYFDNSLYNNIIVKTLNINQDITIFCYGSTLHVALSVVDRIFYEFELGTQIICLTQLYPLEISHLEDLIQESQIIISLEEGNIEGGIGSEILSNIVEQFKITEKKFLRIGSDNIPIPSVKSLEDQVLVNSNKVIKSLENIL